MKKTALFNLFTIIVICIGKSVSIAADTTITITKRYLNLPVSHQTGRKYMSYQVNGEEVQRFQIRLSSKPEYWVFSDMSNYQGKNIKISYEDIEGMRLINQADRITGQDSLYHEQNRPQYHFTTRRGWTNDPNGMVFYEGEYHLFYQHNPFERDWGNMSWGHAVSKDLVHWDELPVALHPDKMGTIFSGSAVVDYNNTTGFGKPGKPAMVAFYTSNNSDKQVQCLAYSLDKGRNWIKYKGNPILDSKARWNSNDTRDPKVFWYKPAKHWVMVLHEKDGHSIYTSQNLKTWVYESHVTGFWECPELFELEVNGNPKQRKWVMLGASNTYMIGTFNGKVFRPEGGKYFFSSGAIYAAQTFNNIPQSDGRIIQMGWGRIPQRGMPFNSMMLLPTALTLRNTKDGIRLFSLPVKETEQLFTPVGKWSGLTLEEANRHLAAFSTKDRLRIRTTLHLSDATEAGLNLSGQRIVNYNLSFNMLNGMFYSPQNPTSMKLTADIYMDRSSFEIFFDEGVFSYYVERQGKAGNLDGFKFWGNNLIVTSLEVFDVKSIW